MAVSTRRKHRSEVGRYLEKEDLSAEHVRDTLGQGADDEVDILPYAREQGAIIVTSDVKDFGIVSCDNQADVILLYDDTLAAYQVASALISMVEAYPGRGSFTGREELDAWE